MAPKQTRDDARTLASEHGGKAYTITMTSPRIKADGTPIDKHIESARKVGTVEQTTIMVGFVTPASFRIDGLSRPVTFSTGIRSPFGGGLTITTLTIDRCAFCFVTPAQLIRARRVDARQIQGICGLRGIPAHHP